MSQQEERTCVGRWDVACCVEKDRDVDIPQPRIRVSSKKQVRQDRDHGLQRRGQ